MLSKFGGAWSYVGQVGASVGLDYLGVANFLSVANRAGLFGSLALPLRFRSFPLVLARSDEGKAS